MARNNVNYIESARVLDMDVFFYLDKGIERYAKECREDFFYPDKVISNVNDDLNDARLTLEVELKHASERCSEAYNELEAARDEVEYDDDGYEYAPDCSCEENAYRAALDYYEVVKGKLDELKELRTRYNQVEAEYKDKKEIFRKYLDKDLEEASRWMKEEYQLMKDYVWQGQQLK